MMRRLDRLTLSGAVLLVACGMLTGTNALGKAQQQSGNALSGTPFSKRNPNGRCCNEAAFSIGFSHDAPQTYFYIADGGSHFITVLRRSDLEVVSEFGGPGVGPGQLGRPHNLSVDPSGNIFVAEAAGPTVKHPATGNDVEAGFRAQKFRFTGTRPAQ